MSTINSQLLELIEQELQETNHSNYYKSISINEYNLSTKLTLDLLVEKYGGYIYRYDNRVTILINFSNYSPQNQQKVNKEFYNKLKELESRVDRICTMIDQYSEDKNKNYFSYMNYFKQIESVKNSRNQLDELVNDVMKK